MNMYPSVCPNETKHPVQLIQAGIESLERLRTARLEWVKREMQYADDLNYTRGVLENLEIEISKLEDELSFAREFFEDQGKIG